MKSKVLLCLASALTMVACVQTGGGESWLHGVSVSRDKARVVSPGMECAEVRKLLGRPATDFQFRSAPGPTWTYYVEGSAPGTFVVNITFDAQCRVLGTQEQLERSGN